METISAEICDREPNTEFSMRQLLREHRTIVYIGIACAVMMAVALYLRWTLISSATDHMRSVGEPWFHIIGTRIPCAGITEIGVVVMYRRAGREMPGRLCRKPWANEWQWYPYSGG